MMKHIKRLIYALLILSLIVVGLTACQKEFTYSSMIPEPDLYIYTDHDVTIPNVTYQLMLGDSNGIIYVDQSNVEFSIYNSNPPNATIDGNRISATGIGEVVVKATYMHEGTKYTSYADVKFVELVPEFSVSGELCVGTPVEFYVMSECGQYTVPLEYKNISVVSGNATVEQGQDSYGNVHYVITARSAGEVTVRADITYMGLDFICEETFNFTKKPFTLSTESNDFFVGYDLKLVPTLDLEGFDPSRVVYTVKSGNATINGANLRSTMAGDVVVYATYEDNGEIYQSDDCLISFDYREGTIMDAESLLAIANNSGEFYIGSDIDLSGIESWTPIENFTGTLYGNGFTIKGLNIKARSLEENKGLFATLGGTVENLKIEGTITCNGEAKYLGLLCGTNNGTIRNVTVSGTVEAPYSDYVGGIAGYSKNSNITGCTTSVSVNAREYVGGNSGFMMAKRNGSIVIADNVNHGAIIGKSRVGGLYGMLDIPDGENNETVIVISNANYGEVTGSKNYVGGIVGFAEGTKYTWNAGYKSATAYLKITDCTNEANVAGVDYIGGIVGNAEAYVSEISFCTNTGDVSGNSYVGGYAGRAVGTTMQVLTNNITVTGKSYVGGIAGFAGLIDTCTNNGDVKISGFIVQGGEEKISYAGGIAGYVTGAANCINNSDIDASAGGDYIGGIAGFIMATRSSSNIIENNQNHGNIIGTGYVGGLFGMFDIPDGENNETLIVTLNINDGEITCSKNYVGGLIGYVEGTKYTWSAGYKSAIAYVKILDCTNEADVTGADYVGGIIGGSGLYLSEISYCSSIGDISGNNYVGGYAGKADGTSINELTNNNTITGRSYVGGIAGYAGMCYSCENNGNIVNKSYAIVSNTQAISYIGGIAGYANGAEECVNNSNINASTGGDYVGGIVGFLMAERSSSNVIRNNKNHGNIIGTGYVGGLFGMFDIKEGDNNETLEIASNINDGDVTGSKNYVGGLIGFAEGKQYFWSAGYKSATAYVKIIECTNEANVTGADFVGGFVGGCGLHVMGEEVIWGTNMNYGNVTGTGEHCGERYGSMG